MCSSFPGLLIGRTAVHSGKDPAFVAYDQFLSTGILQPLSRSEVRCGSFTSLPPYPRVRFTRRADIGPMPAFMSTRPTARPKICLLKSRRSTHAGCRVVRDSTLVAWYRSLYAPRAGGAYDSHHRTTGIAGRTRRGGRCVAAARGQQPAMRVIGFMSSRSPSESAGEIAAFRRGPAGAGFVEGPNLVIAFPWA